MCICMYYMVSNASELNYHDIHDTLVDNLVQENKKIASANDLHNNKFNNKQQDIYIPQQKKKKKILKKVLKLLILI